MYNSPVILPPTSPENPLLREAESLFLIDEPPTFLAIADMIARLNQAQSRALDLFAASAVTAGWVPSSLTRWATESEPVGEALRYGRMITDLQQLALLTPK